LIVITQKSFGKGPPQTVQYEIASRCWGGSPIAEVLADTERILAMYELIELTECELDAVAGGNPFSINSVSLTASIGSTISAALHTAFANAPVLAQSNSSDQSVTITGS
jgi:hypothetical protein